MNKSQILQKKILIMAMMFFIFDVIAIFIIY